MSLSMGNIIYNFSSRRRNTNTRWKSNPKISLYQVSLHTDEWSSSKKKNHIWEIWEISPSSEFVISFKLPLGKRVQSVNRIPETKRLSSWRSLVAFHRFLPGRLSPRSRNGWFRVEVGNEFNSTTLRNWLHSSGKFLIVCPARSWRGTGWWPFLERGWPPVFMSRTQPGCPECSG